MAHLAMATGFALILIGAWGALTQRNLLRMIVAFGIADTGVNIVIVAIGYMHGRTAPILDATLAAADAVQRIIDPVPQALVLTAIVISMGGFAFVLSLLYVISTRYKTSDTDEVQGLKN